MAPLNMGSEWRELPDDLSVEAAVKDTSLLNVIMTADELTVALRKGGATPLELVSGDKVYDIDEAGVTLPRASAAIRAVQT